MIDYNLLEEYTEKCCYKQKVKVRHINPISNGFIYTYSHEYSENDCKEEVTLIQLLNFLYYKIKENG